MKFWLQTTSKSTARRVCQFVVSFTMYKFSSETLIENGKVDEIKIGKLRNIIDNRADVPKLTEDQCCAFLLACNGNVDESAQCIFRYFEIKRQGPDIFDNRDPENKDLQEQLKSTEIFKIPKRTKENYSILWVSIVDPAASKFNFDRVLKLAYMTIESEIYEGPPDGVIVFIDLSKIGLWHLPRLKIHLIKSMLEYAQEGMPCKIQKIHILNTVWFVPKIIALMKPFMNMDLYYKLQFHSPNMKLEEFFENFVPKDLMPSNYEGDLASSTELTKQNLQLLCSLKDFYKKEEDQRNFKIQK